MSRRKDEQDKDEQDEGATRQREEDGGRKYEQEET